MRSAFFDTNIFVYMDDPSVPDKRQKASELLMAYSQANAAIVSLQVLQEYYSVATTKRGVDAVLAQAKVEKMMQLRVVRFSAQDVVHAIELHRLHQTSFWDALIIHASRIGGAEVLFSEDLQHGSRIAGVRIVNPFLQAEAI